MKTNQHTDTVTYIETPRSRATHESREMPVKLDEILEARMQAFMKARRVRRFTFAK